MHDELILVADDHDDIRRVLATVLSRAGYRVLTARDGAEAVALAAAHHPGVVVMDLRMPFMNGWDATCALRALHPAADLPIVAISADHDALASSRTRLAGFTATLRKPFTPAEMLSLVDRIVRGRRGGSASMLVAAGGVEG